MTDEGAERLRQIRPPPDPKRVNPKPELPIRGST